MNARTKINTSHINGSLLFAALAGWLTGSWLVFSAIAVLLVVGGMHSGEIRLQPSERAPSPYRRR